MKLRALVLVGLVAVGAVAVARGGMYAPPPPDVNPRWSPDGERIAYYSYGSGIRVVDADGGNDHAVPNAPLSPQFGMSPDWRQLAAVSFAGTPNAYSLELVQIATGERRTLVPQGIGAAAPAFSPDGTRVAYAAVDGIRSVRLDGTAPIHVSQRTGGDLTWSPDGTRIAYTVITQLSHVEVARADGSGVVDVAASPSFSPSWSPDARTLAFFEGDTIRTGLAGASYTLAGGAPGGHIAWSPDGSSVYYATDRVYRLDLVAGREQPVDGGSRDFALAPGGGGIAFSSSGDCGDRIGIYAAAWGGTARRLTGDCHVYGTTGPDRLRSSATLFQIVDGRGGNDVITAVGAPYVGDALVGGDGNDVLRGGYWPERLDGGAGADTIYGGVNHDTLTGGPGRDRLYGQGGSDAIYARDGARDVVDCGTNVGRTNKTPEVDRAYVDRLDVVSHCENVFRSRR